jgi:hypothetical protein
MGIHRTAWQRRTVSKTVPELDPILVIRNPTRTKLPKENGPEINDFRPVLELSAALANRRLQPLGHLTADVQVYEIQALTRSVHDASNGCETRRP